MVNGLSQQEDQVAAGLKVAPGVVIILPVAVLVLQAEATVEVTVMTTIAAETDAVIVVAPVSRAGLAEMVEEAAMMVARMARRPLTPVVMGPGICQEDGINPKTK
jgi:hypothetical protein